MIQGLEKPLIQAKSLITADKISFGWHNLTGKEVERKLPPVPLIQEAVDSSRYLDYVIQLFLRGEDELRRWLKSVADIPVSSSPLLKVNDKLKMEIGHIWTAQP